MALTRNITAVGLCLGVLVGCASGLEETNSDVIVRTAASLFQPVEVDQLTATRAGLEAAGFDQPLLVGTLTQPIQVKAGLLLAKTSEGVEFWRGNDGSLVKTENGVLLGTVGIPFDLYGADTAPTLAAFQGGKTKGYTRTFRHLNELNGLDITRYFCELSEPTRETIVVFDRQHRTDRFLERCVAEFPEAEGITQEIENIYWKDTNRLFFWKSEQWISNRMGTILLERVFE